QGDPVTCLATNSKAQLVIGLTQREDNDWASLMSFTRRSNEGFVLRENRSVRFSGDAWLSPVVTMDGHHVAMWTGEIIQVLSGSALVPAGHWEPLTGLADINLVAGFLLASEEQEKSRPGILLLGAGFACYLADFWVKGPSASLIRLGWTAGIPPGSTLV